MYEKEKELEQYVLQDSSKRVDFWSINAHQDISTVIVQEVYSSSSPSISTTRACISPGCSHNVVSNKNSYE